MDEETLLIDEALLRKTEPELGQRIEKVRAEYAADPDDAVYGAAFRHFLLFDRWPDLVPGLSPQALLYNRYYWLLRFTRLHERGQGFDAGIEQMVFQFLERIHIEIDWLVLERIHRKVLDELGIDEDF